MVFEFISPSEIKPQGWILKQLNVQAKGLNGNLDKIWPDIKDSKWVGGQSEGWERLPYFLDGFIPLAFLLDDADKKARAKHYIECILEGQDKEGCFRPKNDTDAQSGDIWHIFLILKVLTVYADCLADDEMSQRIEDAVRRGLKYVYNYTCYHTVFNWAAARWYECLIAALWLRKRTLKDEEWIIDLAKRLRASGIHFSDAIELWNKTKNEWNYETHVVNIAMALKSEDIYCELTGEKRSGLPEKMLETLDRQHGTAYDYFTGDECLSGDSPNQGSELCGIVEAMYSYEWLTAITGETKWGDRMESLAYNALPATVSADMWTHQYVQQVNQIACIKFNNPPFRTNNAEANMFGLEPNYGCCTANFGQGWPKFVLSAYMKMKDGIAILSPIPARLKVETKGKTALLECKSEYPFRQKFTLNSDADLIVKLRIPAFTKVKCLAENTTENGWMTLRLKKNEQVEITYITEPYLAERPDGRKCLRYGSLLFALPIKGKKEKIEYILNGVERKFPYCDYSIMPQSEWRYAFADEKFTVKEMDYDLPFDRERPPLKITAKFARINWGMEDGYDMVAAKIPNMSETGERVLLEMQPYGSTDLRVTELGKTQN